MTPKRFKAVCTETGREFFPESQGLQSGPDMRVSELKKRKGKVLHHWPLQVWVPAEYTNRLQLCQSTGLTDSRGVEVFEGDMIVYNYPAHATHPDRWPGGQNFFQISYSEGGFRFSNCMLTSLAKPTFDNDQNHVSQAVLKKSVVIGNAWMSYKELKSMAEAVSNDKA